MITQDARVQFTLPDGEVREMTWADACHCLADFADLPREGSIEHPDGLVIGGVFVVRRADLARTQEVLP